MRKSEFVNILKESCPTVNEGITSNKNENCYPRIVYWDYIWEDIMASGNEYEVQETYQVSFYSLTPKHKNLLLLRDKLREAGIHPVIYHEYVEKDKVWHSYFKVEVIADEQDV